MPNLAKLGLFAVRKTALSCPRARSEPPSRAKTALSFSLLHPAVLAETLPCLNPQPTATTAGAAAPIGNVFDNFLPKSLVLLPIGNVFADFIPKSLVLLPIGNVFDNFLPKLERGWGLVGDQT